MIVVINNDSWYELNNCFHRITGECVLLFITLKTTCDDATLFPVAPSHLGNKHTHIKIYYIIVLAEEKNISSN